MFCNTARSNPRLFLTSHRRLPAVLALLALSNALTGCFSNNSDTASLAYRDCAQCPLMIDLEASRFLMGTAEEDRLIDPRTGEPATNDGPQHTVQVPAFSIGQFEVSVAEFAEFVTATGYETVDKCMEFSKPGGFSINSDTQWNATGFSQSDNAPVGCVSLYDAQAYTQWLSLISGQNYRLPTEAEWEYAARGGASGPYFWGNTEADACAYANVRSTGANTISKRQVEADEAGFPCDDGFVHTSPAGSFAPNAFGLYDVQGNNWEWVADCNHKDYVAAPTDGSAWAEDNCQFGVIRGGSYLNLVERSSVTVRAGRPRSGAATNMGFRVVKGAGSTTLAVDATWNDRPDTAASPGAALFNDNCAACHQNRDAFAGLYGKDSTTLFNAIKNGGNNVMSMPAFGSRLTDAEIRTLADYVVEQNHW
jgi:formylglycine-generating enzyme